MSLLTVFSREACPLCDEMLAELAHWAESRGVPVQVVDVDTDPVLARRYGLKVPLLDCSGETVCFGRLDLVALEQIWRP